MTVPSPSMRDLARRLLADSQTTFDPQLHEVVVVVEKLRISLTRFAGSDGFTSLLRRALALASAEVDLLRRVTVGADGYLQGIEQLTSAGGSNAARERAQAAAALAANLLGLLESFIGEPFTLRLVREAWPDLPLDARSTTNEEV